MSDAPTELLRAAVAVIDQRGPEALTMRAVADQAGCSTTGIYTWFGGKAGLVDAVVADGVASLSLAMAPAYRTGDPVAVARAYRHWALANRTLYLIMLGRAVPGYRPSRGVRLAGARALVRLRRLLAAHGADDPRAAAFQLHATVHGHVMLALVGLDRGLDENACPAMEANVRAALAAITDRPQTGATLDG